MPRREPRLEPWPGHLVIFRPPLDVAYDLGNGRLLDHDRNYVFADNGCASCHTLKPANATGTVGPDLDKIDKPTSAFIKQSIVDPNKVVTEGFQPNIMPQDFGDKISPDELDALVEYLLKAQK